jgi:predicted ATPase
VIPRKKELDTIQSSYREFASGSSELVIIKGSSGTGKSWLLHQASNFVSNEGGIVLSGKFDLMKEQAKPFSALTTAFDNYCDVVLREKASDWAKCVAVQLKHSLGRDAHHLFRVIPKLCQVLDADSSLHSGDSDLEGNCMNFVERLHHLICKFVEVICSSSKGFIALVIDDVQWSDDATKSVLKLLLSQKHQNLFFLCCCRDDEMANDLPFWTMMKDSCLAGVNRTTVELTGINENALSQVLSDLFRLPPRIVRPLRDILYSRTKGNILFVIQLLNSLTRDGCIQLDMDRERWVWDMQKIQAMKLVSFSSLFHPHSRG